MKMDLKVNEQNNYLHYYCKKSTNNRVGVPHFDSLLQRITDYSPEFYRKITILEAIVDDVASNKPTAIEQFNKNLDELTQEVNFLNQDVSTLLDELNSFRKLIQEQIREWGEASGSASWQHTVEKITRDMKGYMDWTTAEDWAEQKIMICRKDAQEIHKHILKKIVTQNKYDYSVAGAKELAIIYNTFNGIQETLNELSGTSLAIILNLKLNALRLNWKSLEDFIININHKRYLLSDCDD